MARQFGVRGIRIPGVTGQQLITAQIDGEKL